MERLARVVTLATGYRLHVERHACSGASAHGTVLLVNGALATTSSFRHTTRYLREYFDVVLYDKPFAGASAQHNQLHEYLDMTEEAAILGELIDQVRPEFMVSVSWGGAAALQALATGRTSVRRAVVASFSPQVNSAMRKLLREWIGLYENGLYAQAIESFHRTLGAFLPTRLQRQNSQYMLRRGAFEHLQTLHQLREVDTADAQSVASTWRTIPIPVLFLNGDRDQYTTGEDARGFAQWIPDAQFTLIEGAGHFLDLEGASARQGVREAILGFLKPDIRPLLSLGYGSATAAQT